MSVLCSFNFIRPFCGSVWNAAPPRHACDWKVKLLLQVRMGEPWGLYTMNESVITTSKMKDVQYVG